MKIPGLDPAHRLLPRLPFRRRSEAARPAPPDPRGSGPRAAPGGRVEPAPPRGLPVPPGVVLLPGEEVLILSVALPRMAARQRQRAAAFAAEERIARPLEEVAVTLLGPAPDPGHWLVAAVDRAALARHAAQHPAPQRLVPEPLALPVPPPGQAMVWCGGGRAVLRLADGTGLAVPLALLPVALRLAGGPQPVSAGGTVHEGVQAAAMAMPPALPAPLAGIDLRHTAGTRLLPARAARLAGLAAAVALAHLGLACADVAVLAARADKAEADLRAALLTAGRSAEGDIDAALTRALAPPPTAAGGGFLPLFAVVSATLAATSGGAVLRDLAHDGATGRLSLTFEAADLAPLQALQAGLSARGLAVVAEGSESGGGLAVMRLTVAGAAP